MSRLSSFSGIFSRRRTIFWLITLVLTLSTDFSVLVPSDLVRLDGFYSFVSSMTGGWPFLANLGAGTTASSLPRPTFFGGALLLAFFSTTFFVIIIISDNYGSLIKPWPQLWSRGSPPPMWLHSKAECAVTHMIGCANDRSSTTVGRDRVREGRKPPDYSIFWLNPAFHLLLLHNLTKIT